MDLIYMNSAKEDIGVMKDYTFDLAFGMDENDFECKIDAANHCCKEEYYLYIEGTEYGGIVDSIQVDTNANEITYMGRTWHGIISSKIICPSTGEDYLTVSGEANSVIASLITRLGLSELFKASTDDSGITIKTYQIDRYIDGYKGIIKVLKSAKAKLHIEFKEGYVILSAVPAVDYSKDEQFDADQIDFKIKQNFKPINHVICLGKGELKEREVVHLYADEDGNISTTQHFTGVNEIVEVYENVNAESSDILKEKGGEKITASWNSNEVEYSFQSNDEYYEIGDIIGAKERITGIEVAERVTKKIISINNNSINISYKVGE